MRDRPRWGLLALVIFGVLALMALVGNLLPDETPSLHGAATTSTPSATPTTPAPTPTTAPTVGDLAQRVETATLTAYGLDSWGYQGSDGWWVAVTGLTSPTSGVVVVDVQDTDRDLLDRAALAVMHGACAEVPELDTVQARGADGTTATVARRDAPLCD